MQPRALALFLASLVACRSEPAPAPAATATAAPVPSSSAPLPEQPPAAPAKPAYEAPRDVAIGDLLSEYKANEIRADGKFKGKVVRTFGTVGQVGKGLGGEPFVTIGTGARLEIPTVQCFLANPTDPEALALSAGGKATVQGRVDRLLGNVMVKACLVNPVATLCHRLLAATGGARCTIDEKTGDSVGAEYDGKNAKSGAHVALVCQAASSLPAEEMYDAVLALWAKKDPKMQFIGSRRVACFGVIGATDNGKDIPFPEPLRAKVQAFFDAL